MDDKCLRADDRVITDGDVTHDDGVDPDGDMVPDYWTPSQGIPGTPSGVATNRDTLADADAFAKDGAIADHDFHAVDETEAGTDLCSWVNLCAAPDDAETPQDEGEWPRDAPAVKECSNAIHHDNVNGWREQQLAHHARPRPRELAVDVGPDVGGDRREHRFSPWSS